MKNTQTKTERAANAAPVEQTAKQQVVSLSAETVEAIASGIVDRLANALPFLLGAQCERLEQFLILHSRLCAADTVHTCERPNTVFRHAIKEAELVRTEVENHFQATNNA